MTSTVSKAELICPHCEQPLHVSVQLPPAFRDDAVTDEMRALYELGFDNSSEGYNGEYGADSDSRYYIQRREEALAAFLKSRAG